MSSVIFLFFPYPTRFFKMLHSPGFIEKIYRCLPVINAEDSKIVSFGRVWKVFNVFVFDFLKKINCFLIGRNRIFIFVSTFCWYDNRRKPGTQNRKIRQKTCHSSIALKERMNCHKIQMKIGINLCCGLHSGKMTGNSGGLPDRDRLLVIRNGTILGYRFFSRSHWPEVDNNLELQGSHRKRTECCLTSEMRIRFWGKRR